MIFDLSIVASGVADQKLASSIMEVLKGHWEVLRVDPKGTCAPAERVIGKHVNRPKWSISENSWISDRFASPFLFLFYIPFSCFLLSSFGMFWSSLGVSGSATIHRGGCRRIARTGSLQIRDGFFAKCHATYATSKSLL